MGGARVVAGVVAVVLLINGVLGGGLVMWVLFLLTLMACLPWRRMLPGRRAG